MMCFVLQCMSPELALSGHVMAGCLGPFLGE